MQSRNWVAYVAGVAAMVLTAAAPAQGQLVTFTEINDAVPSRFFDAEATADGATQADPLAGARLEIKFHTGLDTKTFKYRDFKASTAAFSYAAASDTITFNVNAPEGFYVETIRYTQQGTGLIYRTGFASGFAQWVVNGAASSLGVFGTNPSVDQTAILTDQKTTVPVSITTGLFAFSTPTAGSATVTLTGAEVRVTFKQVVVPEPVAPVEPVEAVEAIEAVAVD